MEIVTENFEKLTLCYVYWSEFKNKPTIDIVLGFISDEKIEESEDNDWIGIGLREDSREIMSVISKRLNLDEHPNLVSNWTIDPNRFKKISKVCQENGFIKSHRNDDGRRNPQYHTYLTIDCDIDSLDEILNIICQ